MKIFWNLRRFLIPRAEHAPAKPIGVWTGEPLDHPAIKRMSLRELADLPFNRKCCASRT
jgi:hypothetical protein